jgi:hypothetical protein
VSLPLPSSGPSTGPSECTWMLTGLLTGPAQRPLTYGRAARRHNGARAALPPVQLALAHHLAAREECDRSLADGGTTQRDVLCSASCLAASACLKGKPTLLVSLSVCLSVSVRPCLSMFVSVFVSVSVCVLPGCCVFGVCLFVRLLLAPVCNFGNAFASLSLESHTRRHFVWGQSVQGTILPFSAHSKLDRGATASVPV